MYFAEVRSRSPILRCRALCLVLSPPLCLALTELPQNRISIGRHIDGLSDMNASTCISRAPQSKAATSNTAAQQAARKTELEFSTEDSHTTQQKGMRPLPDAAACFLATIRRPKALIFTRYSKISDDLTKNFGIHSRFIGQHGSPELEFNSPQGIAFDEKPCCGVCLARKPGLLRIANHTIGADRVSSSPSSSYHRRLQHIAIASSA